MVQLFNEGVLFGPHRHLLQQFISERLCGWFVSGDVGGEFAGSVVEELLVEDLRDGAFI